MISKQKTHSGPSLHEADPHAAKDRVIAAAVTFAAAILILLFLFLGGMSVERRELAQASVPELMPEEEETFLEPEILQDLGEPDATANDAPAPVEQGEPRQTPVENNKIVVPGDNPKPAPQVEKKVTQKKESPVKATDPPANKEKPSEISSSMANKFSGKNGAQSGSKGSAGSGGTGVGINGNANGRSLLGCPKPDVELRHKTTVRVSVVIDADGNVISANASGGADASIRRACERAAKGARWSAKKGAGETRGSITFTITPR